MYLNIILMSFISIFTLLLTFLLVRGRGGSINIVNIWRVEHWKRKLVFWSLNFNGFTDLHVFITLQGIQNNVQKHAMFINYNLL